MKENKQVDFTSLPNIGKVLSLKLNEAEFASIDELKKLGAEKAFVRLKTIEPDACLHELYAIAGAIEGVRWHDMSSQTKADLKTFFNTTFSLETKKRMTT